MSELKVLLACALGLGMSLTFVACDVEDGEDTPDGAFGDGGFGGDFGDGGFEGPTFSFLAIVDASPEENMAGTAGADICGIEVICPGGEFTGSMAVLEAGEGSLCTEEIPGECSTTRADPAAAEDTGAACEPASNPSHYVSMGIGGVLTIQIVDDEGNPVNLEGCTVNIVELVGGDAEAYEVYACEDGDTELTTCTEAPIADQLDGGNLTFDVPEELGGGEMVGGDF